MDLNVFSCVENVDFWRHKVLSELEAIPEVKPGVTPFVLGGFGALGHASTFHMNTVRELRMLAYKVFYKNVFSVHFDEKHQVEAIIDRLMVRPNYRKPTAEAWHRDEARGADPNDVIYGGWINLDNQDQHFSYLPNSTCSDHIDTRGFSLVTPEEKAKAKSMKQVLCIPPGHVLFFNETMVHEVVSRYREHTSVRLFVGFRVSPVESGPLCLHDRMIQNPTREMVIQNQTQTLLKKIETGSIIPLKSGQLPVMYPKLTWSNKVIYNELTKASRSQRKGDDAFQNVSLTDSMKEEWLEQRRIRAPGSKEPHTLQYTAPMFCPSLDSRGYNTPTYSTKDIAILYPHMCEI
jgi:hypothetical protein